MSFILQIRDLHFRYASENEELLHVANWSCLAGEKIFLSGASGSGKSSLIKLIAGLLQPQSGSVRILNQDVTTLSPARRDAFRAENIGLVFQQFNLIPFLSCLDNLRLAQSFTRNKSKSGKGAAISLLRRLNLDGKIQNKVVGNLSIGQQQRVAICRALINAPQLILADEPTSALDDKNTKDFIQFLIELATERESTLIFASHDKSLQSNFDRVEDVGQFHADRRKTAEIN